MVNTHAAKRLISNQRQDQLEAAGRWRRCNHQISRPETPTINTTDPSCSGSNLGYQSQPSRLRQPGSPSLAADSNTARLVPPRLVIQL